jgi:transcriptional regulator with XRE-family HTH domain
MSGAALAAQLTELKTRSRLSYEQLGRKAHLSRSTVHRYCTGRNVPATFAPIEAIATACGAERESRARFAEISRRVVAFTSERRTPDPRVMNSWVGSAGLGL